MSVNADIGGRTPLHFAADYGQTEVLQYLVSKGANHNAKDKHGITVILAAIWEGHTDCVKFLLQKVRIKLDWIFIFQIILCYMLRSLIY